MYPAKVVRRISKASSNQISYWVKCGIIAPKKEGRKYKYSFSDLIKIKLIVRLKEQGLSLQKIQKGLQNLHNILQLNDIPLTRLLIHTDGIDMIVAEKGRYFSAITNQTYFKFDTEILEQEVISLFPTINQVNQTEQEEQLYKAE